MTQQTAKSEEQFMSHNAWFSVFMGIALLIQTLHPLVKGFNATATILIVMAFIGSFIMFCLQGGLKSKKLYLIYQDEFLSAINTKAYKHSVFALCGAFVLAGIFSGNLLVELSHASMAMVYVGVGCMSYGISLLWQSRG